MATNGVEKRGSAATVRACDLCRRRKRRCVWNSGSEGCTPCTNLKETCTTTHVRKPRTKPQRGNRIAEYENRIQRLESLLQERSAAQPQVEQQPLQPATDPVPATEWVLNLRNELPTIPRPEVPDFETFLFEDFAEEPQLQQAANLASSVSPLDQNDTGFDNSASLTIDDIQIPPNLDDGNDFLQATNSIPSLDLLDDSLIPPPLPSTPKCDWYLPPPELGTTLLSEYLIDFNTAYPLYRPHVIADHLRICYAGLSNGSAVSWVSAYAVFGIAHMLRGMSAAATPQDNELAKYYLCRTYISLNSLLLSPPSLGLVQCLIAVANLIRTTPCGRNVPDGHFLSTSLRVAQSLAYHDDEAEGLQTDRDVEQERRVFWLAFISDTNTSLASNSPTTHRREDIVAAKPDENPADSLGAVVAAEGQWKVNIFSLRVNLALLQAEAIEQVLSVKARNTGALNLEAAAAVVLARLKTFHGHELFTLSTEQLFQLLYRSDIVHTVSLEASYFMTIYRLNAFLAFDKNQRMNPFSLEGLIRISETQEQKSYEEARRLLSLLPIAPSGDVGLYWLHHQTFIAALVTVLAHHINNPDAEPLGDNELRGCKQLIVDLGKLVEKSDNAEIAQARELCMSLLLKLENDARVQWLHGHALRDEVITPDSLHVE